LSFQAFFAFPEKFKALSATPHNVTARWPPAARVRSYLFAFNPQHRLLYLSSFMP
jgi:hypothetical protein